MKLLITSDDRVVGLKENESSSNFAVKFDHDFKINWASLLWADIPSLYNIEAGLNNRIDFDGSVGGLFITIPPGHYDISSLTSTIAALLDAADAAQAPHTVSYDSNTQLLTIAPGAGTIDLLFSSPGNPGRELGFGAVDTGAAASHTGTNVVDISGPKYLYLRVAELGVHVKSSSHQQGTFILHLPETTKENFNDNYKDVQYDQKICVTSQRGGGNSISTMSVAVHKPDGSLVNFHGQQFTFQLDLCGCSCGKPFACRLCPNCSI